MKSANAVSLLVLSLVMSCVATTVAEERVSAGLADEPRVVDAIAAWKEWVEYQAAISGVPGMSVRRVRVDEEGQLGEEFVFDLAQDGTVTRYKQHSNWCRKAR
jgi:hypothetical protein